MTYERVLLVGLFSAVALTAFAAMRWNRSHSPARWQITLVQLFVFLTIFALVGAIYRWWYLNEYLDVLAR